MEYIPPHLVERWRDASVRWLQFVIGGILAGWLPFGVALLWLPFRQNDVSVPAVILVLASLMLGALWCSAIWCLTVFARAGWSPSKLPVVRIDGELVTVHWKGETIEAKAKDCNLRIGRAWQMKYASRKAGGLPFGDRDLILIDLPPLNRDAFGRVRAYTTVAVGYTEESLRRWSSALRMEGGELSDALS